MFVGRQSLSHPKGRDPSARKSLGLPIHTPTGYDKFCVFKLDERKILTWSPTNTFVNEC